MSESRTWKQTLGARIPEAWGREIDIFETQMELRKRGKIEEKLFAETRLRRGAYGQRYDNGQRHDGEKTQALVFPSKEITKGPSTMWDAPGMNINVIELMPVSQSFAGFSVSRRARD